MSIDELASEAMQAVTASKPEEALGFFRRYIRSMLRKGGMPEAELKGCERDIYKVSETLLAKLTHDDFDLGNESEVKKALRRAVARVRVHDIFDAVLRAGKKDGEQIPELAWNVVGLRDFDQDILDVEAKFEASYVKLSEDFVARLGSKLHELGMGEADAASVARNVMENFQTSAGPRLDFKTPERVDAAIDLAVSAIRAAQGTAATFEQAAKSAIPVDAPEKWIDRDPKQFPTAESFLRHHYGPRLGIDGDLTQADLSRIDVGLYTALRRQFETQKDQLSALLPTVGQRRDAQLKREYGYVPKGEDRRRKLMALSRKHSPTP